MATKVRGEFVETATERGFDIFVSSGKNELLAQSTRVDIGHAPEIEHMQTQMKQVEAAFRKNLKNKTISFPELDEGDDLDFKAGA